MTYNENQIVDRNLNAGFGFYISLLTAVITIITFAITFITSP